MIKTEIFSHIGRRYKRIYTDSDKMMLHKIGTEEYYGEAIDMIDSPFEYEEVPIPERVEENNNEVVAFSVERDNEDSDEDSD